MRDKIPDSKRVVVTGLGVVSSLGIGWQEFWKNLIAGKSGISRVEAFDTSQYDRHYGGEVKNFDATRFISKFKVKKIGRSSQMAIAASKLALEDGNLSFTSEIRQRMAVCIGMTMAEMTILERYNDIRLVQLNKPVAKNMFLGFSSNSVNSNVALEFGIKGYNRAFTTACSSGNYSIGHSFDLIRSGKVNFALAGGSDSLSRVVYTGFARLLTIAPKKCQPFDKNRKGMIPGEGAGVLLMESLASARKRKAGIYAEVLGYGMSVNGGYMTESSTAGIEQALQQVLKYTNLKPNDIDYISAHGTGTVESDRAESLAINKVFDKRRIPVSSLKSMLGHAMGAASALEGIACCLTIRDSIIPPTINFEEGCLDCSIDCVPNIARQNKVKIALNNSMAFGGNNAALIFKSKNYDK